MLRSSETTRCQLWTHAPQQTAWSLDHLVGTREQRRRHSETERLRGCKIDDEIEFRGLLDRDVGRLRPAQNLIDIFGSAPEETREVWSIGHQASRFDVFA